LTNKASLEQNARLNNTHLQQETEVTQLYEEAHVITLVMFK